MFKHYFHVLTIFICILYGFIPFEVSGGSKIANYIHFFFLYLMVVYVLFMTSLKLYKTMLIALVLAIFIVSVTALISHGEGLIYFTGNIIFAIIVGSALYKSTKFKNNFIIALEWLIYLSIIMLFLQFIVYVMTGTLMQLHEIFFPFSEARIAKEELFADLTRMGGMYIEPGTYSNYMFILLGLYMALTKKINYTLIFISAISIIVTFSVWGMIFASYLLCIILISKIIHVKLGKKILIVVISIFLGSTFIYTIVNSPAVEYATHKLDQDKGSTGHKKNAYKKYEKTYDDFFFIGQGFAPKFKKGLIGLQDAGFLLNLSVVFGILFTSIVIIIYIVLLLKLTNLFIVLATLPIFISKIYFWDPGFWLLYMIIIYGYIYRQEGKKYE